MRASLRWSGAALPFVFAAVLAATPAPAGTKFTIDPKTSLAWWQVNPNLNHLWATTCPEDPSWLPGEGRSAGEGWSVDATDINLPPGAASGDTTRIPLFPRLHVRPVCTEAVHGELIAPDTLTWKGAHGSISVDAATLLTGEKLRDAFARGTVLEADRYPEIVFMIDSITNVRHGGRDTVHADAVGKLLLHGTTHALTIPVVASPEAGGLRVRARWFMTNDNLWSDYGISHLALGLGVGMGIWKQLWMGIDVVLRPQPIAT